MTRTLTARPGVTYSAAEADVVMFERLYFGFVAAFHAGKGCAQALLGPDNLGVVLEKMAKKINALPQNCSFKVIAPTESASVIAGFLRKIGARIDTEKSLESANAQLIYYPHDGRIRLEKTSSIIPLKQTVRVLIVDDSKTIRMLLRAILTRDPAIEIIAEAERPSEAYEMIKNLKPDVITLDIHMPEMTGVELLKKYIREFPIPTIVITSLSKEEGPLVFEALEAGAIDYLQKPGNAELAEKSQIIVDKVKEAAKARIQKKTTLTAKIPISKFVGGVFDPRKIVAIGSSTGGTEALKEVFIRLPEKIPPIVVVQHIPPIFSAAFAQRLNAILPFEVREACDGDELKPNLVLIAPGGMQMSVNKSFDGFRIHIEDGEPVNRHKPSVDVLFDSVARHCGKNSVGVILTGMGNDGATGLLKMKEAGAATIGQNEETCVVYGMPREAVKIGAVRDVVALDHVADAIMRQVSVARKTA